MGAVNIASVPKHIDELRILMNDQMLDILAINETRLDSTISDHEISIPGYVIVRCDRNRSGGGCCLYVRSTISYNEQNNLVPDGLECICIEICKPNAKPFLVATWYRPPSSTIDILDKFERFYWVDCQKGRLSKPGYLHFR